MKIRLDNYDVCTLVNGLFLHRTDYDEAINAAIDDLILRLADINDTMKSGRKKRIPFQPVEIRLVRLCLVEWRNDELQNERNGAADAISELLIRFAS